MSVVRSSCLRRLSGLLLLGAAVCVVLSFARQAAASVTLNYFRVTWVTDLETVMIEWETATELDTVGFIVERSPDPDSGFAAITDIIPAVGDQLTGWTYLPVADDPTELVLGKFYWYRLIIINTAPPYDATAPIAVVAGGWRPIYLPIVAHSL